VGLLTRVSLVVAVTLALLALAVPANAARHPPTGGASAPAEAAPKPAQPNDHPGQSEGQILAPEAVPDSTLAKELGTTGQVDPLAGLGIRNPVCDEIDQIRARATRLACEASGAPESSYPASNYGFDVFVATGVTHPVGSFTAAFVTILNGIWLGLIFVLKLTLSLLGLAFGLNPFADGETMSEISAAVGRMYQRITDPWLSTLVVCAGIWFAYKGLIRREVAAGVAGTLAAVAMLVTGLWVVHEPRASVGQLATLSDQVALATISAPQSGSLARPVGSYAEAMSKTWSRLIEVPFAGLNFSDVSWALGPPPPEAVEKADEKFCEDFGALAALAVLSKFGSEEAKAACARLAAKRYGKPRRIIDLYLRSSPGSAARQALWDYFDKSDTYKPKVAAQGGDGALTRLSMLALFAIGLLGAILLLAWLAIRLFTQAAVAFVLLLAAPFALFFPLLGDSGCRAFKRWGLTLLGALLAKVIYAAFLSVVLLGITILGSVEGPGGSATGFLLSAAFAWAIFLKRGDLIGWISVGEHERLAGVGVGGIAAFGLAQRLGRAPTKVVRGTSARLGDRVRQRASLGAEATRRTARDSVGQSARALAEHRYREAERTVAAFEAASAPARPRKASPGEAAAVPRRRNAATPARGATRQSEPAERSAEAPLPSAEHYRAAKELLTRVDHNEKGGGERWGKRDLARFAAEDRELLQRSKDPADHAHRAGIERTRFEQLKGPERERAVEQIEKARQRDLQKLAVATERPGRIVDRSRRTRERLRQSREGDLDVRREYLRTLRRERRSREHLSPRRNLSRGA
jgi:hypothetical protein